MSQPTYLQQIKALWRAGASMCAIAAATGRSVSTLRGDLAFLGELEAGAPLVLRQEHKHPRWDHADAPPEVQRARALKREGRTVTEIAATLQRSRSWVCVRTKDIHGADARRHGRTRATTFEAWSAALREKSRHDRRVARERKKRNATPTPTPTPAPTSPAQEPLK
ncbi:MAG: hypothetical protein FJ138_18680 [Deltaproteobacteria bacterium]|nr:hypothetical protein [Deltaproteobacteria bacterium]